MEEKIELLRAVSADLEEAGPAVGPGQLGNLGPGHLEANH